MRGDPGDGIALTEVEHFFRHEYGRLVAILARRVGVRHVDLVEDAVQAALETALTAWVAKGRPDDPSAWLYRVARNHVLQTVRDHAGRARILDGLARESSGAVDDPVSPRFDSEVRDDLLRMLFVCCDEAMPRDSRLVLALKTLCGFSAAEIALRLFLSEANVLKRLARAREFLRGSSPDLDSLPLLSLRSRLTSVHTVLYLLFNEGYLSTQADRAIRRELCEEAIRLTTLLTEHQVGATPETFALLALMHLHAARTKARIDGTGGLLLLEAQDRSSWDQEHLRLGAACLQRAAEGEVFTRLHAEAGIAAEHAFAPSFAQTRWKQIVELYVMLDSIAPSPLNSMNRAVAVAEWRGADAGLAVLQQVQPPPWLLGYYLWDAVLGELHRRAGHPEEARRHVERALASAPTDAERELLQRRLAAAKVDS